MTELVLVELKDGTMGAHEVPDNSRFITGQPRLNGRYWFFPGLPKHAQSSDCAAPGTICAIDSNETVYMFYPTGRTTKSYANRTFYSLNADGSARKTLPDGSTYDRNADGGIRKLAAKSGLVTEKGPGRPLSRTEPPKSDGVHAVLRGIALRPGFQV